MNLDFDDNRHYSHTLESFRDSYVLISPSETADCAIVFVHGYGGDSYGTWSRFQLMVGDFESCAEFYSSCDLFFFQYPSRDEWISVSTERLLRFIDELILEPDPAHFTEDAGPIVVEFKQAGNKPLTYSVLPATRRYKRIILVGHSEGAVLIRNGVIKRLKNKRLKLTHWRQRKLLLQSQLTLFAPAIGGFVPSGLLGILKGMPFFGRVLNAVSSYSPAYQDLSGGHFLQDLRTQTEEAQKKNNYRALRADIVWGNSDRIVHPTKYDADSEEFVDGGHIQICKPDQNYVYPIQFVAQSSESIEASYTRQGDAV